MYAKPRIETGMSSDAALTALFVVRIGIPLYLISQYNILLATLARRVITQRGCLSLVILEFASNRAPGYISGLLSLWIDYVFPGYRVRFPSHQIPQILFASVRKCAIPP